MQMERDSKQFWQVAQHFTRMSRWSKNGVLERIFKRLQQEQMICLNADTFSLDSTVIKVHPDGTGALKKMARSLSANPAAAGQHNCILLPHLLNVR